MENNLAGEMEEIRKELGMSQGEFANAIGGRTAGAVSQYATGRIAWPEWMLRNAHREVSAFLLTELLRKHEAMKRLEEISKAALRREFEEKWKLKHGRPYPS